MINVTGRGEQYDKNTKDTPVDQNKGNKSEITMEEHKPKHDMIQMENV